MSAQRFRDAIARLERLKAESTPGPWLVDGAWGAIWTAGETVVGGTIAYVNTDQQTGDHRPHGDAELISVLHHTVDAQLDLLRYGLEAAEADAPLSHYSRELALADAILGGA